MVSARPMRSTMDGLIEWAGAILDLVTFQAPEEIEEAIAITAIELILPAVAIRPRVPGNDD